MRGMKGYIQSAQAISTQDSFRTPPGDPVSIRDLEFYSLSDNALYNCIHPEYKQYIDPRALRRMSPVIRMGLATAKISLEEAGIVQPDAILVGSGLGCVSDTVKFLRQLIDNQESLLNPTAFIQSTHNTVSGQIALMLACRAYNLTFSQNSVSFESALLEAMMLLCEGSYRNILLGGIDEAVEDSFRLMQQNGCVNGPVGEGSTFFVLASEQTECSMARVDGLEIVNQCKAEELSRRTIDFLASRGLMPEDIDLFLSGREKNDNPDGIYRQVEQLFDEAKLAGYKHLAGAYDTASAFGLWLGAKIIQSDYVPDAVRILSAKLARHPIRHILLFNQAKGCDFSWILLSHPES